MIDIKEIIEKHQKLIAKKYKLGNSLVTGHRKGYFDEASAEAIKEIITEVLQKVADNAQVEHIQILKTENNRVTETKSIRVGSVIDNWLTLWVPNKESITSVINKVKF